MAQFRGVVQGSRQEASRLGDKNSGLTTSCDGWELGCTASIDHDRELDRDFITIRLTCGSGFGESKLLGTFVKTKKGYKKL